jgi:hypothetical protein
VRHGKNRVAATGIPAADHEFMQFRVAAEDLHPNRNPTRTRFTKTDLSRYLLAWEQEAHSVNAATEMRRSSKALNLLGGRLLIVRPFHQQSMPL